ncbi:MAG TPA: hypothetical protein VIF15_04730 [Polyangiaceae bacterium]
MSDGVLTVIFQQASDFLAQEKHLTRGAFFLPAPEPLPEPLAELVLRVETPDSAVTELRVRVVQMSATGVALAFVDLPGARKALAPLFDAVRAAPGGEGATWVFWGRPEATPEATPEAIAEPAPEATPETPPEMSGDDALLYDQIRAMSSQEKLRLAIHGDRTARLILLKDVNKTIHTFLLQNPRITLDEIRYIAGYRQANPDALATIAAHKEWGQNQNVLAALIRNPKTPTTTAVRLLDKIAVSELRRLAKSSEVPRAVQAAARKRVTE